MGVRAHVVPGLLALLTSCTAATHMTPQTVYALGAGLDAAEKAVRVYEALPAADPQVIAEMKIFDQQAYAAIEPLLLNQNNATADQLVLAQAALAAFTGYMLQLQVTSK